MMVRMCIACDPVAPFQAIDALLVRAWSDVSSTLTALSTSSVGNPDDVKPVVDTPVVGAADLNVRF